MNVWVALAHERHTHHRVASEWIDSVGPRSALYFCRISQLGLLRTLTTGGAMGGDVLTQAQAWMTYDSFLEDSRNRFMDEPAGIEQEFRERTFRDEASNKLWADAYFATFAQLAGLKLVTFDKALAKSVPGALLLRL
ncbi:TA system VapC family ribonuclease toxin [Granulicella tundricola]|uniref:TA system VapC family ribonuclease toxin n=1 Tax=Granulicella tundricola TaxID=940615 RepID=UPI0001DB7185|nr:TA system VapC family ribonuclease toxin [Granulicella tundricola]